VVTHLAKQEEPRTAIPALGGAEAAVLFEAAVAYHQAGQLDDAERLYRRLLDAEPKHPRVLHLLGVIETQRSRPERGVELIRAALPALANSPEPHLDLGNALRQAGKREEAVDSYRRALALKADYALAHILLAGVLNELGRLEAAISHCRTAIGLDPKSIPAHIALAVALKGVGRLPEAAQSWRRVIELEPGRAQSYYQLAAQLIDLGLLNEAVYCTDRAIALQPDNAHFYCLRGAAWMRLYDGSRAEESFRRAAVLAPDLKDVWSGLSWTLRMQGRFKEADQCIERLREIDPQDFRTVRHIPSTGDQPHAETEIERLTLVVGDPNGKAEDRISAGFALGKLLDAARRYDEAFSRYATANALVRETWPPVADRFDPQAFRRSVDSLTATNTRQAFAEAEAGGSISDLPVFVVGMPRSGTTLVEQICASHSRIYGAGERDAITRLGLALTRQRSDPAKLAAASRREADGYVVKLHRLGRGALRVVDKLPDNVVLVGLISRLFPRARIVYCSRDARDIALSCYFQRFTEGAQHFSYDLADCGQRCRDVQRLATHWLNLLPLHMIEINYERLVADLEGESRRLIEFLGLDWEPGCLDFHRTERTVATVSHWQVRQPIYTSSIGRWRNYEKHLGPLFAALSEPATLSAAIGNDAAKSEA
jgi:tetratricopeptide (TPR) repeat protein